MRVFYAINLPDEVRQSLESVISKARANNPGRELRWVKTELLHLTLHFLGEQSQESIDKLINLSKNVALESAPTEVEIGEWGGFPDLGRPRVIYISLKQAQPLFQLYKSLATQLATAGYETDKRPWRSHITVARNKEPLGKADLQLPELPKNKWMVESFELMKSTLTPDGPIYEVVKSFKL